MALNETFFEFADRGSTSVYKFRFEEDENLYVWFEYAGGGGSLHTTRSPGPFRVEDELGRADFPDLGALLTARATTKEQWIEDLMAQFGEPLAWTYP